MANETDREPARDPQDLERLLIARQWAGDVEGMVALFDPHAVVDTGDGRLTHGAKQSGRCSPTSSQRVENMSWASRVRRSSTEIWRSRRRALPMAAQPPRSPAGKAMEPGYGSSIDFA